MNFIKDKEARRRIQELERRIFELENKLTNCYQSSGWSLRFETWDMSKVAKRFNEIYSFLGVERKEPDGTTKLQKIK